MPVIQNPVGLTLERIVVATNFDHESENALAFASALAKRFASSLTLAHVIDLSIATRSEAAVVGVPIDQMKRSGADSMEQALSSLGAGGLRAHGQTLEAHNPAAAVVELSKQIKADLLVIGTHSRHGLRKLILGSFAEGVIHHASCPVMTIGPHVKMPKANALSFEKIVFAADLRHEMTERATLALALAQDSVAKVYMCHILEHAGKDVPDTMELQLKSETALRKIVPNAAYEWCSPECVVEFGDASRHIVELASRKGANLIVLGAHRSATWFARPTEGVVGHVVAEALCPVLTVLTD